MDWLVDQLISFQTAPIQDLQESWCGYLQYHVAFLAVCGQARRGVVIHLVIHLGNQIVLSWLANMDATHIIGSIWFKTFQLNSLGFLQMVPLKTMHSMLNLDGCRHTMALRLNFYCVTWESTASPPTRSGQWQLGNSVVYDWNIVKRFTTGGWNGYGSIPIHTIFSGMNIHLPAILMWTTGVQGFDTLPNGLKLWAFQSWDDTGTEAPQGFSFSRVKAVFAFKFDGEIAVCTCFYKVKIHGKSSKSWMIMLVLKPMVTWGSPMT